MAILSIPDKQVTITDPVEIRRFFNERGLFFDQWFCDATFDDTATQEEILAAYDKDLKPFMQQGGYLTADVISINRLTENYDAIRAKFLSEHTHSEDEIRFFVDGQGLFWFNLETEPVFNLLCEKGDLISVPAGTKHWFDAGAVNPFVKAIRIFIDMSGWVPEYTASGLEQRFQDFQIPLKHPVKYILTDIEGTTTSIDFVYTVLFPYFREHINELRTMENHPEVQQAFAQTIALAASEDGLHISGTDAILETLLRWSNEDRKITPLKTLQGILWEKGYAAGSIRGHVYPEVADCLKAWKENGLELGVFSSGSVAAQKLIFGYSESGDLTPYFSHYFDTTTGGKRDSSTYQLISERIAKAAHNILFLSDVTAELEAAQAAGFQTVQLVRPGTSAQWNRFVPNFEALKKMIQIESSSFS